MAPVSYITLVVSALTLLLPRNGADAFVHPRPALLRSRQQQQSIMVMSATRRAFLSDQLFGAIGAGVLGLGLATERATAYEVSGSKVFREHDALVHVRLFVLCWVRQTASCPLLIVVSPLTSLVSFHPSRPTLTHTQHGSNCAGLFKGNK